MAQSAQVGIAEADLYPAFSLGGVLGTSPARPTATSINQLFTSPSITFAFGPSFSWPILNYGQITNNVRAQDAELQALLIDYKNTCAEGAARGRGRPQRLRSGTPAGRLSAVSVTAASNALTVALAQYQLGTRDFTTVLTAEQNLYQAQNSLAAAQGNVSMSLTTAYRAMGGGWQIRVGQGFRPGFRPRRDARAHQLGRIAPARRPNSAGDARAPRPV